LIAHGYRDPNSKITKTKTIKYLGYLEDLKESYPDPIEHFKKVVAEMNKHEKENMELYKIQVDPNATVQGDERKNIGYAPLSQIYHNLDLALFFSNRARYTKAEYSVNDIMKTEIYSRMLFPNSKKSTFEKRGLFFEKNDYSLDDVYRCLTFVNSFKDDVIIHLHTKITEKYGRTTELMYYDVTNYFFEIDEQDDLRKKGVSKEHRPDPLVQMGLLQDVNGIPVTYKIFAGNTNDCETLIPVMKEIKRDFKVQKTIIVADKGLNTHKNITYTVIKGNGYVYSQTVRGAHKELKTFVLDKNGYRKMGEDSRLKSRLYPRILNVIDEAGKKKEVRIDEKQVILYSEDYAKRARKEREAAIAKAKDLIKNPVKYSRATSYGAAKYVKNLTFHPDTGEVITKSNLLFDQEKLAEEEKYDGYYAIVTSEFGRTDEDILEIYRGLWKIEESFKVTKTDIKTRPVYVTRENHIQAHFLICFIALTILRILEKQLDYKFCISKIVNSLSKATGHLLNENLYSFGYADEVTKEIERKTDIPLTKKFLKTGDIKKVLSDTKKPNVATAFIQTQPPS